MSWITDNEIIFRLTFFLGVFGIVAIWEIRSPRRRLSLPKAMRWANNLGLVALNSLLLRLLFPTAAIGVALVADANNWGLLNVYELPFALSVLFTIVAMDCIIYLQHVMVHAIPLLWRLHRVHHADPDYDVTTGSRFHPVEIVLSILIKFATIILLGAPAVAVILFEVILNATAMFNHGNIKLPEKIDSILRLFLVTPDMHRVHHSVEDDEANSNFGFSLPWWDRLFGTYRDQPRGGHEVMVIGIHKFRDIKQVAQLPGMLTLPFVGKVSDYVINRRKWGD
ncbi:MAG: sterol desaturase family protein [Gammaproteobacteria bacterium]|nr:sterol desaturase family protein [Gammaproteobacteria bacterium]